MKLIRYGIMALALTLAVPAFAQTPATSTDMQILLAKVKADKKLLVSRNMELTEAEAATFWPIYDAYQHDLQGINDRLRAFIGEYVDAYNMLFRILMYFYERDIEWLVEEVATPDDYRRDLAELVGNSPLNYVG